MNERLCVGPHDEGQERAAEDGAAVCKGCRLATEQGLADLPQWWADLADPNRSIRISQGGKSAEKPAPISDDASSIRTAIRNALVGWCLVLRDDRNVNLPDEAEVIEYTQRLLLAAQNLRQHALAAGDLRTADRYLTEIADIRAARASGADIIGALCHHLERHLPWLLGSEHADLVVHQITTLAGSARRTAHPSRPDAVVICPCGTKVALDVDRPRIVCSGCGEWGDIRWWWDRVGEDHPRPMKITELARWLQINRGLDVTTKQLRNWRDRDLLVALPVEEGPDGAQRFDPAAVAIVAHARLGHGDTRSPRLSA